MKRLTFTLLLLAAAFAIAGGISYSPALGGAANAANTSGDVHVSIDNYAFKAPSITISPGTAVVWKNMDDDPHTVTADDGSFDSKGLGQGDTFRYVFSKSGKFPYHCSAHPYMKGVVVVGGGS